MNSGGRIINGGRVTNGGRVISDGRSISDGFFISGGRVISGCTNVAQVDVCCCPALFAVCWNIMLEEQHSEKQDASLM